MYQTYAFLMVTCTRFELVYVSLRGLCVKPLHQQAIYNIIPLLIKDFNSKKKTIHKGTCDKAGSPWAVLGETVWQIGSAVPFFCFHLFCLCFCVFFATCYRYDTFAHADADFRVSAFLCICGIRYPYTRMFVLAVSPA